jgi:hypothetical protein
MREGVRERDSRALVRERGAAGAFVCSRIRVVCLSVRELWCLSVREVLVRERSAAGGVRVLTCTGVCLSRVMFT